MPSEPIVVASNLTKSYGPQAGVFGLDLEVTGRQTIGLIGPSGSGKTTSVRLMTGLLAPDSGSISVLGQNPIGFAPQMRARIGYMPQDSVFYPDLTLRENLNFAASLYGMPYKRKRQIDAMIDFVDLGPAMDRLLRDASGGEKRRLSLAATLIHKPELAFLDEPTAGVDPILRRKFWDHFEDLSENESTLLITTQYVGEAAYCDYVGVLAAGRLIAFETPDNLRRLAFAGELLDIEFASPPSHDDVTRLSSQAEVRSVAWIHDRAIRVSVSDVGEVTPSVIEWAQRRDIVIEKVEPYLPPFDDVFVELVANHDQAADSRDDEAVAGAH